MILAPGAFCSSSFLRNENPVFYSPFTPSPNSPRNCLFGINLKNRGVIIFLRARQHQPAIAHSRDASPWSIFYPPSHPPAILYSNLGSNASFTRENHSNLLFPRALLAPKGSPLCSPCVLAESSRSEADGASPFIPPSPFLVLLPSFLFPSLPLCP